MIGEAREAAAAGNFPASDADMMERQLYLAASQGRSAVHAALAGREELERRIQQLIYTVTAAGA